MKLPVLPSDDALDGEDTHLSLYCCYELSYGGFDGVDDDWEWEPSLLAVRRRLERRFLRGLRENVGPLPSLTRNTVVEGVRTLLSESDGRSLSTYMLEEGTLRQLQEFAIHRSAYQLKEADPHTWGIPRLGGRAKAALVTIQADEYGSGVPGKSHAELFARTMEVLGLSPRPGLYLDHLPGVTLATTNLISMFGLHRRWRGALVGHLAAFEMTSVVPMGRYAQAVRRLTSSAEAADFYDVHVEADTVHEQLAANSLVAGLVADEPELAADVLFGVAALQLLERRLADHLLRCWASGTDSLRVATTRAVGATDLTPTLARPRQLGR